MNELLAAIDLGSNSFHLQVGRVEGDQLFYLDAHKESVRLAGGLTASGALDAASQRRALDCLARMGERLRGMPPEAVRAVGTNTLRVARNAEDFLVRARAALGFDIEVVAGREEARLIYLGVSHSLAHDEAPRLVVDIGGGSTECIIGRGYQPSERESTGIGCVVYSNRFFPRGVVTRSAMREARLAAEVALAPVVAQFRRGSWETAIGSSGTARALGEILLQNGQSDGAITRAGLKWLCSKMVGAGNTRALEIPGLKPDRKPVIAGGLAVMVGIFDALDIETMTVAQGAMREGILWDLLGRGHHEDMREVTVSQFMRRYRVDVAQAQRVEATTLALLAGTGEVDASALRFARWASRLHEIGLSIAHSGQHRHAAYILENADMPGFSRQDQALLARIVRASRGGLSKLALATDDPAWRLILPLRLAVLLNQNRMGKVAADVRLHCRSGACSLSLGHLDTQDAPLTRAALEVELRQWQDITAAWHLKRLVRTA